MSKLILLGPVSQETQNQVYPLTTPAPPRHLRRCLHLSCEARGEDPASRMQWVDPLLLVVTDCDC
jgi:hypothetical protein